MLLLLGATYDAIEGHFRKIRKEAIQLRQDHDAQATTVSSSSNTVPTTSRKSRAKRAPRKEKAEAGQSVLGGRIKKPSAPARKPKAIKQEVVKEEGDALRETDAEAEMILGSPSATISFDTTDDIWLSRQNSFSRGFGI